MKLSDLDDRILGVLAKGGADGAFDVAFSLGLALDSRRVSGRLRALANRGLVEFESHWTSGTTGQQRYTREYAITDAGRALLDAGRA